MKHSIASVTFIAPSYDEAIAWFTEALGFSLVQDVALGHGKRWVVVAPPAAGGAQLILAEPADERQAARIGDQAGGRVFLFLHTDDFWRDHARMKSRGVRFLEDSPARSLWVGRRFRGQLGQSMGSSATGRTRRISRHPASSA